MSHVLCHNKAAAGGGAPKHYKDGHQFFLTEAKADGDGQENHAEEK